MQTKVLIITHGIFGIELKKSAEMIMGEQEDVQALGLVPGQSVDDLEAQAFEIIQKNAEEGVHTVVMCDLMGGSPSNVSIRCLGKAECDVLLGVNMPMLIGAIQSMMTGAEPAEVTKSALEEAQAGLRLINRETLKSN